MIRLVGISLQGKTGSPILADITLKITKGDWVALVGPSGCGKSTIFEILVGYSHPSAGKVFVAGQQVNKSDLPKSVGYVPQDSMKLILPWRTGAENLELVARLRTTDTKTSPLPIQELLSRTRLTEHAQKYPLILSGGEQKRLALAMVLTFCPDVILLDEPFTGVDLDLRFELWNLLFDYRARSPEPSTMLFVTHSLEEAAILCDYIVFMRREPFGTTVHSASARRNSFPGDWAAKPSELYRQRHTLSTYLLELDRNFADAIS